MKLNIDSQSNVNLLRFAGTFISQFGNSSLQIIDGLWKTGKKLYGKYVNEGIYEVLEHETTLTIHDVFGNKVSVNKRQKVKFLQNNVIAFQDQVWGDGEILENYRCSPGKPADIYRLGHKNIILISLREEKSKGDIEDFNIEWEINNGFLTNQESWGTEIKHQTSKLSMIVIFPTTRPPHFATISQDNKRKKKKLRYNAIQKLPDGKWQLKWECKNPSINDIYTLEWKW